jgi:ATP-binding cassette subfamily C protein
MTDLDLKPTTGEPEAVIPSSSATTRQIFVVQRLAVFVREFAISVPPLRLTVCGLLILLGALTEGISLILLVPLVELISDTRAPLGWIGRLLSHAPAAVGLPVSLPVLLLAFVGLVATRSIIIAVRDIELGRLRTIFTDTLRTETYRQTAAASWSFLMRQKLSDILDTLTSHVEGIGIGASSVLRLPALAVVGAIQVAIAFSLSPPLTIGVVSWGGLLLLMLRRRISKQYERGLRLFNARRASFAEMSDFLSALKLAKSRNAEVRHVAAFAAAVERQTAQSIAFDRSDSTVRMFVQIGAAVSLGAFVYAAVEFAHVSAASLIVMVIIFARLSPLVSDLQQGWESVARTLPVFDSMLELRRRCAEAVESIPAGTGRIAVNQQIRFVDVCFQYDKNKGPPTIAGVDFVIPAATTIAIAGRSGAGKSTLADLLLGLVVPDAGSILVDGAPLRGARLGSWRRSVGYVPQDNFLFNATVRANLLWACPDADETDIHRALSIAAADEFVARLPKGLDTVIGERGLRLSGGERQRLGLARALLCNPTLLILDEATSALDHQTERAVQTTLDRLHGSMTIVIIAHRLSTIRSADRILVLEQGRLAQEGTWDALHQDPHGAFAALVDESGKDESGKNVAG